MITRNFIKLTLTVLAGCRYVFLLAYGAITPSFSTTFFMVFSEALGGAPAYWVVTLLVSVAALIPFFTLSVVKTWFFPDYHNKIQWLQHTARHDDPEAEFGRVLRQFSVRGQFCLGYLHGSFTY